ncbi:MAG: hypothetical protein Q4D98_13790 [Planctomycetia bacterium]|nr:hypothetical protein [Planctomycetia bacterium]
MNEQIMAERLMMIAPCDCAMAGRTRLGKLAGDGFSDFHEINTHTLESLCADGLIVIFMEMVFHRYVTEPSVRREGNDIVRTFPAKCDEPYFDYVTGEENPLTTLWQRSRQFKAEDLGRTYAGETKPVFFVRRTEKGESMWFALKKTQGTPPSPRANKPKTPKAEGGKKTSPPTFNTLSGDGKRDVLITLREEMVRREAAGRKMTDKEIIDFVNSTKLCKVGKNALVGDTSFSKIVDILRKNSSVWTKNSGDLMDEISE